MNDHLPLTEAQLEELLPLYRLGALEPDEVVMVEAHLAANPHWQPKLAESDLALVALAESAPHAALPVNARERLLAAVRPEGGVAAASSAPRPVVIASDHTPSRVRVWWQQVWQGRGLWPAAAALTFAALLFLIFYTIDLNRELVTANQRLTTLAQDNQTLTEANDVLRQENDQAAAANQLLSQQIRQLQTDFQTNRELLASAQTDPDLLQAVLRASNTIVLHNHVEGDLPRGVFYQDGHSGQLVVHGLDPLPQGQTYQFWAVTRDGVQIPAGFVTVLNRDGATWTTITIPATIAVTDLAAIGISIEPDGGSPSPTSPMLLDGEL
ncbi:MAG: anti-sigma factor [Anaerolineae bacterium]|nr:anti-sigma factor [Anaerolineae bacterium]